MNVKLLERPGKWEWMEVKRRALVTVGLFATTEPTLEWKQKILRARHSPIRYLRFSFLLEGIPSWVSVHLCRHVHAQPYVRSQRNDRQDKYDRNKAQQDVPVDMIWDMNAEELMVICNKRLCQKASPETREVVRQMADLVLESCPEFDGMLVPMCAEYINRPACREMVPCYEMEDGE